MTHLWEAPHPYYCAEGNFYAPPSAGLHTEYDSWAAFSEEWSGTDTDRHLVFRWDWHRGSDGGSDRLLIHWVLQREAILRSTACAVTEADEPAVRAWLTERAEVLRSMWAPLLQP